MPRPKVLFATDFSSDSDIVREHAVAFARDRRAIVLVVHVRHVPSPSAGEGMLHDGLEAAGAAELARQLEAVAESISERDGVDAEAHLLQGDASTELLRLAEDEQVELIAMGTHGRTGLRRAVMGSVAEEVMRRAPCPVLTVRAPRKPTG